MATKRRSYTSESLKRRAPKREPYDRVLIVCEGQKTEPNYFSELCNHYRLSSANIVITPGDGSDPVSVVKTAEKLKKVESSQGDCYDRIYCVFDRDEHTNYTEACNQIRAKRFCTALSIPAFEYWLLLHFDYTRAPFHRVGTRTAAQNCERALKGHLPGYEKGTRGLFQQLLQNLPDAMKHGSLALEDACRTREANPSTEIQNLVSYLMSLKDDNN